MLPIINKKIPWYAFLMPLCILFGCGVPERPSANLSSELPKRWTNSIGMEMSLIPAGKFLMDSEDGATEKGIPVTLTKPFYMGRSVVTKGMLKLYFNDVGEAYPELGLEPGPKDRLWFQSTAILSPEYSLFTLGPGTEYEANHVSWTTANNFCNWLSKKEGRTYRLPTEAEWEYAKNGGAAHWPWFSAMQGPIDNWGYYNGHAEMYPFWGLAIPGWSPANPYGLYPPEFELVQDRYAHLSSGPRTDPTGPTMLGGLGNFRVLHLGGFGRGHRQPDERWDGFRVVCAVDDHFGHIAPLPPRAAPPERPVRSLPTLSLECGPGIALDMLKVPAGSFMMGRPKPEIGWGTKEWPQTQVTIPKDYWLGRCEVTQAQFRAVTGLSPSWFKGDDRPVECVNYVEIIKFLSILNQRERAAGRLPLNEEYRLPTEAEWEYACRAGTDTLYSFGDDPADLPFYEVVDVTDGTHPVASKRPNPWGFFDMGGNVLELTGELFRPYPGIPSIDPFKHGDLWPMWYIEWVAGRGGAWCLGPYASRTTFRRGVCVMGRCYFIGFRLARGQLIPPLVLDE